jgi:hypothetical protein
MTSDILKRFNRDTRWLVTGLLGTVAFAALVLAVEIQEHHPKSVVLPEEGVQTGVDHAPTKISPQENSFFQLGRAASTPATISALAPETDGHDVPANAGSGTLAHRQAPGQVIESRVSRARSRSSIRSRIVDVKRRLIALWHKSLIRNEQSRPWTFANSNIRYRNKVSYTVATDH